MSFQLPTILSPPTRCTPVPALTVSPQLRPRSCRTPFPGRLPSWTSPLPRRLVNASGRIEFISFLFYGLVVRFRLPSTPPLDDAVAFSYGQPVPCPTGTFTPLLVRTLGRTRAPGPSAPGTRWDNVLLLRRRNQRWYLSFRWNSSNVDRLKVPRD